MKYRRKEWFAPAWSEAGRPLGVGGQGSGRVSPWVGGLTSPEDPHYSDALRPIWGEGLGAQPNRAEAGVAMRTLRDPSWGRKRM